MKFYSIPFCILIFSLGSLLSVNAQSSAQDVLWVRSFAAGAEINGLFYKTDNGYQELPLQPFKQSYLISMPYLGAVLPLYTKYIVPDSGEERYVESAKVVIPDGCRQIVFAVMPKGIVDGIRNFDTIVYDDSEDAFPVNTVRLINLSPYEVGARFGERAFKALPGKSIIEPVEVDEKSRVFAVAGQLSWVKGGYELRKFYQGPISIPKGRRLTMMVIYSVEGMLSHGYDVMQNSKGEDRPDYIVVSWLDRPMMTKQ